MPWANANDLGLCATRAGWIADQMRELLCSSPMCPQRRAEDESIEAVQLECFVIIGIENNDSGSTDRCWPIALVILHCRTNHRVTRCSKG